MVRRMHVGLISSLTAAILAIATLGNGDHVAPLRRHHLGPQARAEQLATMIASASEESSVPPYLLAALAYSESGYDGRRRGSIGEWGIMQAHPKRVAGRLYRHARARGWSQDDLDLLSIHLGADELEHSYQICGNWRLAIGHYRTGRCVAGRQAQAVIAIRDRMRQAGGV